MANRDRNSPLRGGQDIFRGIDESRGSLLNAEGGRRGSDVGNTKPLADVDGARKAKPSPRPPHKKP